MAWAKNRCGEGQIKVTQFEDSRSNDFISMRKLIILLFKNLSYALDFKINLMD